jgi:uncharacterized membrane protein YkvA (DUF1232 family)
MNFTPQSLYEWYRQVIRNPRYRWWIILGTIVYLVSPIDVVPDFLPIIGQIDDVVILTLLVSEVSQLLIDRVKTGKGQPDATVADATRSTTNDTVDVNAAPVE